MYLQRNTEQEFIINLGDIKIEFGKLGINEITHPVSVTHSDTFVQNSDWISPYVSGTVTNGEPDMNHATVGGNHGTDGGGGFATANSVDTFMSTNEFGEGGRNLVQDSNNFDSSKWVTYGGSTVTSTKIDNDYTNIKTSGGETQIKIMFMLDYLIEEFANREVTISFDIINHGNDIVIGHNWLGGTTDTITSGFNGKYTFTGTVLQSSAGQLQFRTISASDNLDFDIKYMKVETGPNASAWSPAYEDVENIPQDGKRIPFEKVEMLTINEVTNKANIDLTTGERLRTDFLETVRYKFEHNHIQVEVELEALEDFYINWYLGLQLLRNAWRKDAYFNHDLAQTGLYAQTTDVLNSGTKAESPDLERVTIRNDKGDVAHIYTDKNYGIGYSQIRDTDPILYLSDNYRKVYFHLVKRYNNLIVPKGTKVKYRGGYIFGKNKAKNATTVTYFTENGIKKAYVDFKVIATENIKYTSVEESFNCTFGTNTITSTEPNAYAKVII